MLFGGGVGEVPRESGLGGTSEVVMWMDGEGGGGREYPVEMDATTEEMFK